MTLSFAVTAAKAKGVCLLSIDTEGTDGTTTYAGGITDSSSMADMERGGVVSMAHCGGIPAARRSPPLAARF